METAFEYANRGTKGELTKHEYKIAMIVLFGHCPDKWETKQIFQNSSEQTISYETFINWAMKKGFDNDTCIDAQSLFVLLDSGFKGHVTMEDFYSATQAVGLKVSKSVWRRAFKEMDQRGKSLLTLDELSIIMNGNGRGHVHQ